MSKTVREIIAEKALLLRDVDALGPEGAARELVELSSLLASLGKECADRKYIYSLKRIILLKEHITAAKATIYGEGSSEYKDWSEADEYRKATVIMIQSIKYYLRNAEQEARESRY